MVNWSLRKILLVIKKKFVGYEVKGKVNYHYLSGFVKIDDTRYVYFSTYDERNTEKLQNNVLFRTATGPKDFTGGYNNFIDLESDIKGNDIVHKLYGVVN